MLRIGRGYALTRPMVLAFNAAEFVANVKLGKFDGCLTAELKKLSMDELQEVVEQIMRERAMTNPHSRSDPNNHSDPPRHGAS